ncbi:MAG: cysteine desulfurase [Gammaproteobacteria bacterium]|nr:cysteine desulfurase [Gammaproteobacteria bacterium]
MTIYLDHNATTPLDQQVLAAMMPYLRLHHGNSSSVHRAGRVARSAIDQARIQVAALVNVSPAQVVFTSGGTEANNLALQGMRRLARGRTLAISAIEHASVLQTARSLQADGVNVRSIDVDAQGRVVAESLQAGVRTDTALVSVMMANNETGTVQDMVLVAEQARQMGAILHTDAVQVAGKVAIDFAATGAQLMSLSAHKLNGPKGVGALIIDRAVEIEPLLRGGGQEAGLRSGTENVAGIVGFGAAAELAAAGLKFGYESSLRVLRDRLESGLATLPGVTVFGRYAERLPNTVLFGVAGYDGEALVLALNEAGIAVSSGSACDSHSGRAPSHVLLAMGVDEEMARSAIRVSLGRGNTTQDVEQLIAVLAQQTSGFLSRSLGSWA